MFGVVGFTVLNSFNLVYGWFGWARLVSAWVLRRWFCCGLTVLVFVIIIDDVVACCVLILVGCYGG